MKFTVQTEMASGGAVAQVRALVTLTGVPRVVFSPKPYTRANFVAIDFEKYEEIDNLIELLKPLRDSMKGDTAETEFVPLEREKP